MVLSTVFAERAARGLIEGLFHLLCMWRGIRKELRCFRALRSQLVNKTFFSKLCNKRCCYELSLTDISLHIPTRITHPLDFETLGQIIPDRCVLLDHISNSQKIRFP
jgi:hypothetical protein